MHILLVEDRNSFAHLVTRHLARSGYTVDHVGTIRDALKALSDRDYSATLLDRKLPDGDGMSIIKEIKRRRNDTRVLLLTAMDAVGDKIEGLDSGADDYLVKPFDLEEMMARIRACLRRSASEPQPMVTVGALSFDCGSRTAAVRDRPVLLHKRELALLEALVQRAGVVVRHEALIASIWGVDDDIQPHALTLLVA